MGMKDVDFNREDHIQMQGLGISEDQVKAQIQTFRKSPSFARLCRPCTVGDGIQQISPDELDHYTKLHEGAAQESRFTKFVPASGAASRMFQFLFEIYGQNSHPTIKEVYEQTDTGDRKAKDFLYFKDGIRRLALFDDLKSMVDGKGLSMERLLEQGRWQEILEYLLTEQGLNYGSLPKGLLKFHRYPSGNRTALEEHLVEAIDTVRDRKGICRIHLTVSPEHEKVFRQCFEKIRSGYEQQFQCFLKVTFSTLTWVWVWEEASEREEV